MLVEAPSSGNLALNPNGSFIYTPAPNFFGNVTLQYAANDFRNSEPATVTIEVAPQYDPPIAVADQYRTQPTDVLRIPALVGLQGNDINIDKTSLRSIVSRDQDSGSLQLAEDGSFVFDPQGISGEITFEYRLHDDLNVSEPAPSRLS